MCTKKTSEPHEKEKNNKTFSKSQKKSAQKNILPITMPKKKSAALLQKLSSLLKISIFLPKLNKKKPIIIQKLIFFKKTRKLKKFQLLNNQYSRYGYVKEYEFSPSNTPLIQFGRKMKNNGSVGFKKLLYSNLLCLEMGLDDQEPSVCVEPTVAVGGMLTVDLSSSSCGGDDSVDERAERFIQRFYEEMRRQRQEYSSLQMIKWDDLN